MTTNIARETALVTYTIDPAHSRVGFTARHMGFSKVRGRFERFSGTIRMIPGSLRTLEVEVRIDAASINTNETKRDAHLRSADFFESEAHPELTFKSTGIRNVSGESFILVGELTMRGVKKTVELEAEYLGEGKDPWGGTRVAFEARTKVNRRDFGLNWNQVLEAGGVLVSETVEIELEIQAVQEQA